MATVLTEFRVVVPNTDYGTPADNAINQFYDSMSSLCQLEFYTAYIRPQNTKDLIQQMCVYGLLTTAQQTTALGYLNTLNAALGYNVLCTVVQVTQE